MSKLKRKKSIETLKSRYGIMFISPWIIGMILFVIVPIFKSAYYSFASIGISEDGVQTSLVGLKNFIEILVKDPAYPDDFLEAISNLLISLPFILVVSIVLALLLNGKYKGRIFFRGLYFLPVIIASGVVLDLFLDAASSKATQAAISDTATFGMIDFGKVLEGLSLPSGIQNILSEALSRIFLLVWQSGIQTILIIAGLQSIPDLLYEVAKVEGATKWEEFWFITLPMMMRTMLLVIIFSIVELVSSNTNSIVSGAYSKFNAMEYGVGSAMLWFYFLIVGVLISVLFVIYNRVFLKRWG